MIIINIVELEWHKQTTTFLSQQFFHCGKCAELKTFFYDVFFLNPFSLFFYESFFGFKIVLTSLWVEA